MHLVLVNVLICLRKETILILDIHQRDVIVCVCVCVCVCGGGWEEGDGVEPPTKFSKRVTA